MRCLGRIAPFPSGNAKNTGLRIEISEHSRAVSPSFRSNSPLARAWGPVSQAPERQVPQIAAKLLPESRGNGVLARPGAESVANSGDITSLPVAPSPVCLRRPGQPGFGPNSEIRGSSAASTLSESWHVAAYRMASRLPISALLAPSCLSGGSGGRPRRPGSRDPRR